MARINLLPWREARREELKRAFLSILGLVAAMAVVLVMLADRIVNAQIDNQRARNEYQGHQTADADRPVAEKGVDHRRPLIFFSTSDRPRRRRDRQER